MNKSIIREIIFKNSFSKFGYIKLSRIKNKITCWFRLCLPILKYKKESKLKRPVFLIFTPEHANLGDHAIAYSEMKLLRDLGINFYEITGKQLEMLSNNNYLNLLNGSCLLINGGGNLGLLWPEIDQMNKKIIAENGNSRICFLPNSIYYPKTEEGDQEMLNTADLFNNHSDLILFAREKYSYDIMRKIYNNVELYPDMVLYLDQSKETNSRYNRCLISFREDVEKTMSDTLRQNCLQFAETHFQDVQFYDTVRPQNISKEEREKELKESFKVFRRSELVITDRLHGMIFAAITGTKCLAFEGKGNKIRGCYQWIKNLDYIQLIDANTDIKDAYLKLLDYPHEFNNKNLKNYYLKLKNEISNIVSDE